MPHRSSAGIYDASVNGSNGEVCKGYWWELLFPFTRWRSHFDARKIAAGRFVYAGEATGLLAAPYKESLADSFAGIIERANAGMEQHRNTAKLDNVYLTLRMQRWQGRIASSTMRIWPCVAPFTFRRPMELSLSAAPFDRLRNRMSRRLIEHLDPRLAALPMAEGYPASPLRPWNAHRFLLPASRIFIEKGAGRLGLRSHSEQRRRPESLGRRRSLRPAGAFLDGEPRLVSKQSARGFTCRGPEETDRRRAQLITRILTLEMLVRMVNQV